MDTWKQKYLTASKKGSWHRTLPIAVVGATWLVSASSAGALDIKSIQLSDLNEPNPSIINNVTYQGQSQSIISFRDTNNTTWLLTGGPTTQLSLRRSGTGDFVNQQVVFGRQPAATSGSTVLPPVPNDTRSVLAQNNIFSGTDNLFSNRNSENNNQGNASDVERVDFIFNQSETRASNLGVTVFERGPNNSHDGFKIAAITSLNGSDPTGYGSLLNFNSNSWGKNSLTENDNYTVLNTANDPNTTDNTNVFSISDSTGVVQQNIGGVVIPLTQLVSSNITRIYGYSLFSADVSQLATSNDLVNLNFPNNTPGTGADGINGGIDLLSANLGVVRAQPQPVPFKFSPSLGLLILGATWGAKSLWQRNRIKPVKLS